MLVSYLKEEVHDRLFNSVEEHLDWYCSDTVDPSPLGIDGEFFGTSSVDMPVLSLSAPPSNASDNEKNQNDLINIKSVYSAWKGLNPHQARNRYMWSYYCHFDQNCKRYILARWMNDRFSVEQVRRVFFVSTSKRNLVRENALSSLWWKGYLTYDEDNSNNHFLLAETLGSTTNFADFLDTINSYNPTRAKGLLKGIYDALGELGLDSLSNKHFRILNRFLNHYAAVSPLDFYTEDEIRSLVKNEFIRISLQ